MTPLGSYYFARRLPAARETDGGIALPDVSVEETNDYLVFGAGPGRVLDSGRLSSMQAAAQDRIIVRKAHFAALDEDEQEGFVADEHLVALIPGPQYEDLYPAGDYVMIQPDRTTLLSSRGIIVATDSLPGGATRMELRGEELRLELRRLQATPRFRELNARDAERCVHDFLDHLSREDVAAIYEAFRREAAGRETYERRPVQARKRVTSGRVLRVGRGQTQADGNRRNPLGNELFPGSVVRWSEEHRSVRCSNGEMSVLFIQAQYLLAVQAEAQPTAEDRSWPEEDSSLASPADPRDRPALPGSPPDGSGPPPPFPSHGDRDARSVLPLPGLRPLPPRGRSRRPLRSSRGLTH